MKENTTYPCPCCGYQIFNEPPGSFDICPICYWEDDLTQLRFPKISGANHVSLIEGQCNYQKYSACEEEFKIFVRLPTKDELIEDGWRIIDIRIDNIEEFITNNVIVRPYPDDTTMLYYWRNKI